MLLALLCVITWGSHFARNSFPIFGAFFLIENAIVTPKGLGILLAISSLPSTFLPLFSGYVADKYFPISMVMEVFLVLTIIGQVFLTLSFALESFSCMCFSVFLFGCGSSSVTSLQRSMIPLYLPRRESISIGITMSMAHIAKVLGKLYVLPLVSYLDSFVLAATCNIFVCFVSWVLFRTMTDRYKNTMTRQRQNSHGGELHLSANDFIENLNASEQNNATEEIVNSGALHDNFRPSTTRNFTESLFSIPREIYVLIMMHALYLVTFHVFLNFVPDIGRTHLKMDRQWLVIMSCLPSVVVLGVAPVIGAFADLTGRAELIFVISSILVSIIFELMINESINGFIALTLLSIFQSILTTLTLTVICKRVAVRLSAMTFGLIEVVDSIGSMLLNIGFGYLFDAINGYRLALFSISIFYWLSSLLVLFWFFIS